jgi:glycosyltransferase involved in cell wall biosynthesis
MTWERKVSVIIPAYNEFDIIGETLNNLCFDFIKEVIVVNDGSNDNTLDILKNYSVNIINLSKNIGKGKAVESGLNVSKGDVIALIDADIGVSVREIEKLVIPVLDKEVDMTIAIIPIRSGGLGLVRLLSDLGLRLVTGKRMIAPLSGQRVFNREIIKDITPFSPGFGLEIGIDIDIIRKGIRFKEIECNINHKVSGKDFRGFLHRMNQFFSIFLSILNKR